MKILPLILYAVLVFADHSVDVNALNTLLGINYRGQMFSGYLPVKKGQGEFHYFYYPSDVQDAPLMLWLQGGPGCSSMQGAVNENGPFVFQTGTPQFQLNEYSWTKFASMLYLESPLNVGYSYGPFDMQTDDTSAEYNLEFIVEFLELYDYHGDFHIAGESYAGVYIPTLAAKIIQYNNKPTNPKVPKINLKSILIGNGCTHPNECQDYFDSNRMDYFGRQGFVSDELYEKFKPVADSCRGSKEPQCQAISDEFDQEISGNGAFLLNAFNIYEKCFVSEEEDISKKVFKIHRKEDDDEIPPCVDAVGMMKWFRDRQFMDLIHIKPQSPDWTPCTSYEVFKYTRDPRQTYYLYPQIIKAGIRILKYSGDVDSVVPISGTLAWIDLLQKEYDLPTLQSWRPWFVPTEGPRAQIDGLQNAGNILKIEGLTFLSVKGAGHLATLDKRHQSFVFASKWLSRIDI